MQLVKAHQRKKPRSKKSRKTTYGLTKKKKNKRKKKKTKQKKKKQEQYEPLGLKVLEKKKNKN